MPPDVAALWARLRAAAAAGGAAGRGCIRLRWRAPGGGQVPGDRSAGAHGGRLRREGGRAAGQPRAPQGRRGASRALPQRILVYQCPSLPCGSECCPEIGLRACMGHDPLEAGSTSNWLSFPQVAREAEGYVLQLLGLVKLPGLRQLPRQRCDRGDQGGGRPGAAAPTVPGPPHAHAVEHCGSSSSAENEVQAFKTSCTLCALLHL